MAVDKRIEVELALRDTVSLTLKAVSANLDEINKKLAKGGEGISEGVDAFKKIKETTEGVRKTSEEGGKEATATGERMLPLLGMLRNMGPAAAIAAGVEVGRRLTNSIADMARERLKLKEIHEETGLTESIISIFKQAQERLGIKPEKGLENIEKFGSRLRDMATYGPSAAVFKELHAMDEGALANTLLDMMKEGKGDEAAMTAIRRVDELEKSGPAGQAKALKVANAFKVGLSFFHDLEKEMQGLVPEFQISVELAQRWMIDLTNVLVMGANVSKAVKNVGVIGENIAFDYLATIWDFFKTARGPLFGQQKIPADQLEAFKERNKETLELLKQILNIFQNVENKQSIEKRWVGGPVLPGRNYLVGERGPETLSSGGSSQVVGAGGPEIIRTGEAGTVGTVGAGRHWGMDTPFFRPEPRAVPGNPEETWNRLNRALTKRGPWIGYGEGRNIPSDESTWMDTGVPLADILKNQEMEQERSLNYPGWGDILDRPRGFYNKDREAGPYEMPNLGVFESGFRSTIDSELSGGSAGSLGAQIIFNNVPEGVETNAEGDGFDNFSVSKTRQLGAI